MTTERFAPGSRVAGTVYRIVEKLAEGGMGAVYEVEDTTIGKRYVLKSQLHSHEDREELARRMANEARVLARLGHPNIVDVITAGVTADEIATPFFVMERLTGRPLSAVLAKRGQLDVETACRIAVDVLDALGHAHDNGVIHRDVKPDNIFIHRASSHHTVTKLLDFGIMHFASSSEPPAPGTVFGTLRYMTPEAVLRRPVTPAVDLFTTGLVLYEMLAGRGPWDDRGGGLPRAYAHATAPAPPPSQWNAAIPEPLERLILRALSKEPEHRPRDAAAFARELRLLVESKTHPTEVDVLEALELPPATDNDDEGLHELARTLVDAESLVLPTAPPDLIDDDVAPLIPRRVGLSTTAPTVVEPEPPALAAMSTPPRRRRIGPVMVATLGLASVAIALCIRSASSTDRPLPTADLPYTLPTPSQPAPVAQPAEAASSLVLSDAGAAAAPRAPRSPRGSPRATSRSLPGVDF